MYIIARILVAIVAIEHLFILWLEMFGWKTAGKKIFKDVLAQELFEPTKGLAANQGLYNGFLSAGLIWSFFISNITWQENISLFFIACVIIAGIYGSFTISKRIFYTQSLPAIAALVFLLLG